MTSNRPTQTWRKSSFSGQSGSCVEIADTAEGIAVRNSNHPDDATLEFPRDVLAAFVAGCKAGEFDHLA